MSVAVGIDVAEERKGLDLVAMDGDRRITVRMHRAADVAVDEKYCLCGCGQAVRRRFIPGHDAKLKSQLRRLQAEGQMATERLRALGWLHDD